MYHPIASWLILPLLTSFALGAAAEKADRDKPMNIEADALRYDDAKKISVFTGRVVLNKGSIQIRGERVEVRQDAQGFQYGVVTAEPGKRAFFRQKREGLDQYIEGEGSSIDYKSYGSRKVVKDVSLKRAQKARWSACSGPNGAGKTTSFYMIVGLVRADAGEITIDGQSVEHMPIHRRSRLGLSYLPQEASIFRKLNVSENVRAVLELQHDSAGKPLDKAEIERA
jgi:lipopolysaccharide transport protein LptA